MTKVIALMSMSLDGFVADGNDGVAEVFDWYFSGDVEIPMPTPGSDMTSHTSPPSADHVRGLMAEVGAFLTGRRTFDVAHGWDGRHPVGMSRRSSSHSTCPTAGRGPARRSSSSPMASRAPSLERSRLRARSPWLVHGAGTIQQCLDAGLLDEIRIDLVAVLLGAGVRLFDHLDDTPVVLGDPTVVASVGVTHLRYPVLPS